MKEEIEFFEQNTIVYDKKENKLQYRTVEINDNKAIRLLEKGEDTETSQPYIGLAYIYDWKEFWGIIFLLNASRAKAFRCCSKVGFVR